MVTMAAVACSAAGRAKPFDGGAQRDRRETTTCNSDRGFCSGDLTATDDTLRNVRRSYKREMLSGCFIGPLAIELGFLIRRSAFPLPGSAMFGAAPAIARGISSRSVSAAPSADSSHGPRSGFRPGGPPTRLVTDPLG